MADTPNPQEIPASEQPKEVCRVLSLDGGGAKGFYTLGVLREIEAMVARSLSESFDLIFGTSTGAILTSLLALGFRVEQIPDVYNKHVPTVKEQRLTHATTTPLEQQEEAGTI